MPSLVWGQLIGRRIFWHIQGPPGTIHTQQSKMSSPGTVEVTVNTAESGGEGDEAVETLRHSPRRTIMDRKKLADKLIELDQKSTTTGAKGNLGQVSSGAAITKTTMGNEVSAAASANGKSRKFGTFPRKASDCDGSKSSSAGASADTQPSDLFSSNISLSACSLLDVEDNADDDDDEDEEDEDLGPMTRKAFSTCDNHDHGINNACNGGDIGQPTRGGKLASILRGCGTCGTGTYCTAPSCTACSSAPGRTQRVSPTNNDLKSFAKRGVCFSETLVTDTHERPRTEDAELNNHFYNVDDFRKFKRQARDEGHCEQQLIHMLRDFCTGLQDCSEGDFG